MLRSALTVVLLVVSGVHAQWETTDVPPGRVVIGKLKYPGGGDWYANATSLPNLQSFLAERVGLPMADIADDVVVDVASDELYDYPLLHMTGHGNVKFTDGQVKRLRRYFERGGFLHADDNYGMDEYWRREVARIFPDSPLVELPLDHEIYHNVYDFADGLPKIHEHHGGPARGYGVYYEGRMVIFYSYNTDLGDGWEDPDVHKDPAEKREAALKMGANIFVYALTH